MNYSSGIIQSVDRVRHKGVIEHPSFSEPISFPFSAWESQKANRNVKVNDKVDFNVGTDGQVISVCPTNTLQNVISDQVVEVRNDNEYVAIVLKMDLKAKRGMAVFADDQGDISGQKVSFFFSKLREKLHDRLLLEMQNQQVWVKIDKKSDKLNVFFADSVRLKDFRASAERGNPVRIEAGWVKGCVPRVNKNNDEKEETNLIWAFTPKIEKDMFMRMTQFMNAMMNDKCLDMTAAFGIKQTGHVEGVDVKDMDPIDLVNKALELQTSNLERQFPDVLTRVVPVVDSHGNIIKPERFVVEVRVVKYKSNDADKILYTCPQFDKEFKPNHDEAPVVWEWHNFRLQNMPECRIQERMM